MNTVIISLGIIGFIVLLVGFWRRIYDFMLKRGYEMEDASLAGWVLAFYPACMFLLGMVLFARPADLFLAGLVCFALLGLITYVLINLTQPPNEK